MKLQHIRLKRYLEDYEGPFIEEIPIDAKILNASTHETETGYGDSINYLTNGAKKKVKISIHVIFDGEEVADDYIFIGSLMRYGACVFYKFAF